MKKRIISLFLVLCLMVAMLPTVAVATDNPFTDVKTSDWFYNEVQYVYENGLMNGIRNRTFRPNAATTRGMVVTVLYRLEGSPAVSQSCTFKDVTANSYYETPIAWASENGIVYGYNSTTFGPDDFITREQMAIMLYRYADYKGYDVSPTANLRDFEDTIRISPSAKTAMKWANAVGLIYGTTNTTLEPKGYATRAQIAAVLMRFCEKVASKTYTVTFDSNGGSEVESQNVAVGGTVSCPEDPVKEGYRFVAWYSDEALTEIYDFATEVTKTIILYSKWEIEVAEESSFLDENDNQVEIYSFNTDTWDILADGSEHSVTFTAEIFSDTRLDENAVSVVDDDSNIIGYMNDNGENGDEAVSDGIYTLCTPLSSDEQGTETYYAEVGDITSYGVTIGFYVETTDADYTEYTDVVNLLTQSIENYTDENGYVYDDTIESAKAAIEIKLEELISQNVVEGYTVYENSYSVHLTSGIPFIFMLAEDNGTDKGIGSGTIATYQPFKNTYSVDLNDLSDQATDGSASTIINEFDGYLWNTNLDLDAVTLDALKSLGNYSIVLWHGHGGYGSTNGSFLAIGELQNSTTYKTYKEDIQAGRVIAVSAAGRNVYAISGGFVSKYVQKMDGAFLYLAACSSGKDMIDGINNKYSLAQAFIDRGATAVVANSGTICTSYNTRMERDTIAALCEVNAETLEYNTLSQAIQIAFSNNGPFCCNQHRGFPIIFPQNNSTASEYRLGSIATTGNLSGSVKDASSQNGIAKALVRLYDKDGNFITSTRTDSTGKYLLSAPVGDYVVKISAGSYKSVKVGVSISADNTTYLETFLLISNLISSGYINGIITNSLTNTAIPDVTLKFRKNWNNKTGAVIYATSTNDNGYYEVSSSNLPVGVYTMEMSKSGFIVGHKNVYVWLIDHGAQNAVLSPIVSENAYRIVLTWGENPRDLDSHVVGKLTNGDSFHVYYSYKSQYDGEIEVCNLDIDDTTSYGPETITLNITNETPYYYYIYRYAGSGTVATSGAQIKVYHGSQTIATYNVPTDQGSGDYWNVFAIVDGRVVVKNTITTSADTSYAN